MTKKIIALALFVAMLVALVPVASAAYTDVDILTSDKLTPPANTEIWYAKAVPEALESGDIIGVYGSGKGVKIEVSNASNGSKTDITITGKYADLQSYYYDYTGNTSVYGKAVKIPFAVFSGSTDVTANSTVNGGTTYYSGYVTAGGDRVYYLNFALVEGGNSATYKIKYQNNDSYTVNVKFVDTDGISLTNGTSAKLEVIGIAGLQKNNFRAEYANGAYVAPAEANGYKGYYANGALVYNIAALTAADRKAIYETGLKQKTGTTSYVLSPSEIQAIINSLGEGQYVQPGSFSSTAYYTYYIADPTRGEMTARLKAFDENGVPYSAGTIVLLKDKGTLVTADDYEDWNEDYLGYSEKFVNVDGKATYLVDRDNSFAFTVRGIVQFAWMAAGGWNQNSDYNTYLYKLTMAKNVVLQFVKTNTGAEQNVKFDIVFQNIDRTTSGITLLAEEMEVVVGDTVMIPYIIDNPYALTTALKSAWVSTNDKIVAVANAQEGYITAKAAGKAYVYCTDALGKVKLVIVNAVATPTAPVEEVVTPAVTKYVVTASRLNFREGPATSYKSLGLIERNTVVEGVEAPANGWVKVSYKGQVGYCSGKYLAEID